MIVNGFTYIFDLTFHHLTNQNPLIVVKEALLKRILKARFVALGL